jgi:hypothetical protein
VKRVFDDPNHANYGAVRRLFVVLSTLFSDIKWDELEVAYRREWGLDWDTDLVGRLPDYGCSDAPYHREMVQNMIVAFDNR